MAFKERNRNMKVEVKLIPEHVKSWNWKIFKQLNGHLRCKHVGQASLKQLPETQLLFVLSPSFSLSQQFAIALGGQELGSLYNVYVTYMQY